MSIGVRIRAGDEDRIVTRLVQGLRFRKTAPGGHADASATLDFPYEGFTSLGPNDRVYLYDTRSGETIWEGYTTSPGASGRRAELAALGGSSLLSDMKDRYIWVDAVLANWRRAEVAMQAASLTDVSSFPDTGTECLKIQFPSGQPSPGSGTGRMVYDHFIGSRHKLGGYRMTTKAGKASANFRMTTKVGAVDVINRNFATSGLTQSAFTPGDFSAGQSQVEIRIQNIGATTNIGDDDTWGGFSLIRVAGQRLNVDGSSVAMGLSHVTSLTADEVVADIVGMNPQLLDPQESSVATSAFLIDQLAYLEPTTIAQVLDDLSLWEPDYLWSVHESNADGKHRFTYTQWPTLPRYELGSQEGFEETGGDFDLCNRIQVSWVDTKGIKRVRSWGLEALDLGVGSPVDNATGLANPGYMGRIRDADLVELPDGLGTFANAERIALQTLTPKTTKVFSGRATVQQRITDTILGMPVDPWEIEPGNLVRHRETGRDYRLSEVEYEQDSNTATLMLNDPIQTIEQRVARLQRNQSARNR
ncbi:MAG: hypothetical protein ACRCYU_19085 [Nocardioides sp.]